MESEVTLSPDAIIVLSGGTVLDSAKGPRSYRSTTYEEHDAFGTLGGRARVEAAAILARKYPDAFLVTTSIRASGEPTHAHILSGELVDLGVDRMRIILEETSTNAASQISESLKIAQSRTWHYVLMVSSEYHKGRVEAFIALHQKVCTTKFISAEQILEEDAPEFSKSIRELRATSQYQKRLASEARGLEAIKSGTYGQGIVPESDKWERS